MARMVYSSGNAGRTWRPWWAIDYPDAEYHFTRGLRRLTTLNVADDSQHLKLTDEEIFDYPWLFAQQVGRWYLDEAEIAQLREYVLRGGFIVFDDFHGEYEWVVFTDVMRRAFPEWPITRLPETHELMNVTTSTRTLRFRAGGTCIVPPTAKSRLCCMGRPSGMVSTMKTSDWWWQSISTWTWVMPGNTPMILCIRCR
jgi:hypothetical protein